MSDEALAIVNEIIEMAEERDDLPDAGQEFSDSVAEKARDIGDTIEERGYCTDAQLEALENMRDGLARWFR